MAATQPASESRLGGILLIAAVAIMAVGASIPFMAPSLREAPWSDDWDLLAPAIAGNTSAWVIANGLFLAAAVLTTFGLVAFSSGFGVRARPLAQMGVVSFGLAATLSVTDRIISMSVATWAAEEGLPSGELTVQAFVRLDEGFNLGFFVLGFLAVMCCGLAMAREPSPAGGWWVVVAGVVGLVVAVAGLAIPAFVYLATAAIGLLSLMHPMAGHTIDSDVTPRTS